MKNLSVDEALTIVCDVALDNVPDDIGLADFMKAWNVVVAFQLLNLRGKPFPLSTGS